MASAAIDRQGVVQDELTGEKFIPASQRPDGTWRKARRVREGYVPQEEVPTYENKGVQWMKSRSNLPPGLNPDDVEKVKVKGGSEACVPGLPTQSMSKSAKKNQKRKEKKKQQPQEGAQANKVVEKVTDSMAETSISTTKSGDKKCAVSQVNSASGGEQDIVKKVRNLKKKLKQIEDLEAKIKSGELKTPEKEQMDKVAKKQTLISEIDKLEKMFDNI